MKRIELRTKDGHHVAWVEVPPFQLGPDVVIWGERVFVAGVNAEAAPDVFFEAFAVVSLTPSPGLS